MINELCWIPEGGNVEHTVLYLYARMLRDSFPVLRRIAIRQFGYPAPEDEAAIYGEASAGVAERELLDTRIWNALYNGAVSSIQASCPEVPLSEYSLQI